MNERIRQLYYECQDESQSTEQCYQKFAELIVRECAEMGDNFDGQPSGNAVRKYLTAGDAIREYFGVE
jgi:hypothetical protein